MPFLPPVDVFNKESQYALLIGSKGSRHLFSLAVSALNLSGQASLEPDIRENLFLLGRDILLAAWEEDLLNGNLAADLLAIINRSAPPSELEGPLVKLLGIIKKKWHPVDDLRYFSRLLAGRELQKVKRFLEQQWVKEPDNIFWIRQAIAVTLFEGDFDLTAQWINRLDLMGLGVIKQIENAQLAMCLGDYEQAVGLSGNVYKAFPLPGLRYLLAESLYRLGSEQTALHLWKESFQQRQWDTNLVLRLSDMLSGRDKALCSLPGRVAVLLYSWNKANDLEETLYSLAASDLGENFIIRVLDNGSTDHTGQVLAKFAAVFGPDIFESIKLPVNIGAPQARNWLLARPEVRSCDFVAFLDDDVILPGDWLRRLAFARSCYKEAGVWGCRVVDAHNPIVMQCADLHIMPPAQTHNNASSPLGVPLFGISDLQHQLLDLGQFDYMRPCSSVTGCCHLFSRKHLEAVGGFDLRFSPSQYDDLDHDLRLILNGTCPVYQGHLRVKHLKRTGKSSHKDEGQLSNSVANMYKLQQKFSADEFTMMRREMCNVLSEDLERKRKAILAHAQPR